MLRIKLLLLYSGFFFFPIRGKDIPGESRTYTVYINYQDGSVRANVLRETGKLRAKQGRLYYWYSNNDIKKTEGGFDGKLLHGEYKSFYRNMNLKEQGNFCHGLKTGDWLTWHENGRIRERMHFNDGLMCGAYVYYNENGQIVSRSAYKNGLLNGRSVNYQGDTIRSEVIYKKGKIKTQDKSGAQKKDTIGKAGKNKISGTEDTARTPRKSRFSGKKIISSKAPAPQDSASDARKRKPKKAAGKTGSTEKQAADPKEQQKEPKKASRRSSQIP